MKQRTRLGKIMTRWRSLHDRNEIRQRASVSPITLLDFFFVPEKRRGLDFIFAPREWILREGEPETKAGLFKCCVSWMRLKWDIACSRRPQSDIISRHAPSMLSGRPTADMFMLRVSEFPMRWRGSSPRKTCYNNSQFILLNESHAERRKKIITAA